MSLGPAEVLGGLIGCLRAREYDRLGDFLHPEVEWTTTGVYLESGVFRGKADVRGYMERIATEFDPWQVEVVDLREVGVAVVSHLRVGDVAQASGAEVALDLHTVARVEEGVIRSARNYRERAEALRAATTVSGSPYEQGLRAAGLEPNDWT